MKRGSAYYQYYSSPLGDIVLTSDEEGLNGLWFRDEKAPRFINPECLELSFLPSAGSICTLQERIPGSSRNLHRCI